MRYFILPAVIILLLAGCKSKQTLKDKQQELEAGKLDEKSIYHADEVGWTAQIPGNWEVLTKKENERINEKGKKLLEESSGNKIDNSGFVELINLKKNAFNSFISSIEPFNEKKDGSYEEHNVLVRDMMKKAYESKKIHAEYEESTESVNGLPFDIISIKLYSPDDTKIILRQKMYSRLINGYDFSMTISYNNEEDQQTMMDMINSSKFSIRK